MDNIEDMDTTESSSKETEESVKDEQPQQPNETSDDPADLKPTSTVFFNHENSLLKAEVYKTDKPVEGKSRFSWEAIKNLFRRGGGGDKNDENLELEHFGGDAGGGRGNDGSGDPTGGNPPPATPPQSNLTFDDCGGLEKQIKFLQTALLGPLKGDNTNYQRFGLETPKGILFYGPPGTGKTRLAQALGNEIENVLQKKVHFIYRKGQDIASKYFGQSSENLRRVFIEAMVHKPTVLFFDELDGLCPSRDSPHLNQENVTIVTTMLGLMDDLPMGEVFVIGATNRLEAIDASLRRPGRFDKYLQFTAPDVKGRLAILKIHTKHWKLQPREDLLQRMSQKTSGYSGADLAKLSLDAFDNALNRLLGKTDSFWDVDFSGLEVQEGDWLQAFAKMKPTTPSA